MEFNEKELVKWYPRPLVAFEGQEILWLNEYASILFDGDFSGTLSGILGHEAAGSLSRALDAGRRDWTAELEVMGGSPVRAELAYFGESKYIAFKQNDGSDHDGDVVSALLSNAGKLYNEPLASMRLAMLKLEDELGRYAEACPGSGYSLNLTGSDRESGPESGGVSIPRALAQLNMYYSRLLLLSRNQAALYDTPSPARPVNPYDAVSYLRAFSGQANSLAGLRGIHVKLVSDSAVLPCRMPPERLRRVVSGLLSLAVRDVKDMTITLEIAGWNGFLRLAMPVPGGRLPGLMLGMAFSRTPRSEEELDDLICLRLVRRILSRFGGRLFWDAMSEGGSVVVTIPLADGLYGGVNAPMAESGDYDTILLSGLLDAQAYLPEWTESDTIAE